MNQSSHIKTFDFKNTGKYLKKTFKSWNQHDPFRLSAVVAYYTLFSLPALLIIIINAAGAIYGEQAVQGKITAEIETVLGSNTAQQVQTMLSNVSANKSSVWATIISIATLIFGATGAFYQLQKSLDVVWNVKQDPNSGIKKVLFDRATGFGLIIIIAFLLLITLILTTALSVLSDWIQQQLPDFMIYVFYLVNFLVSLAIITLLFALIFKVLPDVKVPWKAVWMGALFTAILFVVAKFLLGIYFGMAEPGSVYGAAGSIVLILLWVSYSCMILFFGAEFTKIYSHENNINVPVSPYAVKVKEEIVS
ncbi:MAG: YihY/virulence factor BrkB family protein [Candidatus Cyclobacteriaceae bacterium M3_2C_046]